MESLSFESTIESPTKPHQEKVPDKNNKSLFLVQTISETEISKQPSQNLENNETKEKTNKKESSSNILNFDDVLSIVFPKEKPKKQSPKKSREKLLNNKRKRPINKSKIYKKFMIYFIYFFYII